MKTFGSLWVKTSDGAPRFVFAVPPHIRMRIKSAFPRVDKGSYLHIGLKVTSETCRDVEWFCDRFPLEMSDETRRVIENGSRDYRQRLESLEAYLAPGHVPRAFPLSKPLRGYQAQAVEVHAACKGLLLADDLGLGKTVSAMGTLTVPEHLPALVVCPVHLCAQWRMMLGDFLPLQNVHVVKSGPVNTVKGQRKDYRIPDSDVVICSYSKMAAWGDSFSDGRFRSVIFDEIQELRHNDTRKYKAAKTIAESAAARIGLSATPIFNYGGEIFNILDVIAPGRVGEREEFYREWCHPLGNGKYAVEEPEAFGLYLRDQFLMLRRRRQDVGLELPDIERTTTVIPHDGDVMKRLEGNALELARLVLTGAFEQSGEAARQFDIRLRQATGIAKAPHVADFVRMIVENGEKVLLFGWHREVYDIWVEKLKDLDPVLYTGSESPGEKQSATNRFVWGSSKVMIMSLRSGVGVDGLQKVCRTAVFGELDWSPAVHAQCEGRLNRDGVPNGVLSYFLVSDAGSDPVVAGVLGLKTAQHRGIVDMVESGEVDVIQQQSSGHRVKQLAAEYLKAKGQPIPERPKPIAEEVA